VNLKHLHEGWDYRLYKIYIWGGLPLLVIYIVTASLILDRRNQFDTAIGPWIIIPLVSWVSGIMLYWWWVFLFKGSTDLEELGQAQRQGVPDIKSLKSWSTLQQAMAIRGGDVKELIKNEKRARRPILLWYGSVNLLVLWILCPVTLGSLGFIHTDGKTGLGIWVGGVLVWIALMLVGTPFLIGWGGKSAEKAYLAPLGLAVTQAPGLEPDLIGLIGGGQKLIPDGPAIVEGQRYGRLVHVETIGKHSLTVVQAEVPEFGAQSRDGKLIPNEGAPEAVVKALRNLRKAKRWRGIAVYAGPTGIGVQRQSKGTNMWLYDLWLAEYLLDRIDHGEA
jgi:hypothetical protein